MISSNLPKRSAILLALFSLLAAVALFAPGRAEAAASPSIKMNPYRYHVLVNETVSFSGAYLSGSASSRTPTVYLQRYVNGRWEDRASAPVTRSTGYFKLSARPSQTGSYTFRVRSAGGGVVSPTFHLKTWRSIQTFSGIGNRTTGTQNLTGGNYYLVASYTGKCVYLGTLESSNLDSWDYDLLPPFSTNPVSGSYSTNLYNLDPGPHFVDMYASGEGCGWWHVKLYK